MSKKFRRGQIVKDQYGDRFRVSAVRGTTLVVYTHPGGAEPKYLHITKATKANPMSKKKTSKCRNSSRKGKMPAGLKKYWAKKPAQKRARRRKAKKNPPYHPRTVMKRFRKGKLRSRSGRKVTSPSQAKAILLNELRASGYDIAPKPNPRRRRKAKRNPRKMKGFKCGRCKRTFKMNSRPKSCPFCRIRFK